MRHIDPVSELGKDLFSVQNPVRYLGGEYGQTIKEAADLTFALSFPDLYEIAMSNTAIKILYDGLNRLSSVRCERVFAPAPDFEGLLKARALPLYTLESGIPLNEVDILGVSIGYEPGITGLLSILDTGNIPVECSDRTGNDPIVLAGGCGITNPVPFSRFIDAFFIGEAEAGLFELVEELAGMKRRGASRSDLLGRLEAHPSVWTAGKNAARAPGQSCARRAIYSEFGSSGDRAVCFPVPHLRVVQDHGVVEIMRGCPNGCRFCHAGIYYRPQRMKEMNRILADVDYLVHRGGYREVSLMSLSSGDYNGIEQLMSVLTSRYPNKNVSFQLPSLKVNSFTLPLLEKMSEVRKSGLTFAIETPVDAWQLALNKEVYRDKIVDIMLEARKRGWRTAKFYFMIGLPIEKGGLHEEEEIVNFLFDIQDRTRIQCTANIGTFIPKPHTPYQWSRQLSMAETNRKLDYIHGNLPKARFKVSTNRPFNSFVEGMMSRGDSRVGGIILEAYRRGCRLDAWDDWAKPDVWRSVIDEADWNVEAETIRERSVDEQLPWDGVSLGASKAFLKREKLRSDNEMLTPRCSENCGEPCGICGSKLAVKTVGPVVSDANPAGQEPAAPVYQEGSAADLQNQANPPEATHRVILSFSKRKEAAFIPHLGLLEVWHKAFQRSGIRIVYTEGFNPLPRFELAQSMSLGTASDDEIASFLLYCDEDPERLKAVLNQSLPESLRINRVLVYPLSRKIRRDALTKFLWGNRYAWSFRDPSISSVILDRSEILEFVAANPGTEIIGDTNSEAVVQLPFEADRPFRDLVSLLGEKPIHEIVRIRKLCTLAKAPDGKSGPVSFFDAFDPVARANTKSVSELRA